MSANVTIHREILSRWSPVSSTDASLDQSSLSLDTSFRHGSQGRKCCPFYHMKLSSSVCLLITLTCSPKAELRRAQRNSIGRVHVKGASMAAAKRSCMIPEHSTQARCFLTWESIFGEGGKPEYPEKNPQVRLRSTETQPKCNGPLSRSH